LNRFKHPFSTETLMNAIARDLSAAANVSNAMARDLLGFGTLRPSAITYHTILSSLDTGAGLSLADTTWAAGTQIAKHVHREEDEVLIILSGTVEVRLGGRSVRRKAGETMFIPRGMEHSVLAVSEARHIAVLTRKSLEGPRPA
jgi:quercetin dioxygenase-like cupin family protein